MAWLDVLKQEIKKTQRGFAHRDNKKKNFIHYCSADTLHISSLTLGQVLNSRNED